MPIVELVMCPSCRHPQEASERCVACGAALPAGVRPASAAPAATSPSVGVHPAPSAEGGITVTLAGRTLTLLHDRLTLSGEARRVIPTAEVLAVRLSSRRLFEALAISGLFAAASIFGQSPVLRMLFAVLALLSVFVALAYRLVRCQVLPSKAGETVVSLATVVRHGSADALRIARAFELLRLELAARRIEVLR